MTSALRRAVLVPSNDTVGVAGKCLLCGAVVLAALPGCGDANSDRVQGYVEGEFVYVASPLAGALLSRPVQRGDHVKQGDILFRLEDTAERAARDEALQRAAEARARLEDAKKGKRPTEIEAIEAQLREAQAALTLAEEQYVRQERLYQRKATTEVEFDRAESEYRQARQRVVRLEAELQTAHLGERSDLIEAAAAQVQAAEAALAVAEWNLSEKQQEAPQSGLVFDTLFREGEWVAAGQPVVALLPPQNIKVRAFVPEPRIATLQVGQRVRVWIDGRAEPVTGTVRFISPKAEFTPPVIYSRESRSKLVFLVEIEFDDETAATLHPGQPVDVEIGDSR